MNDFYGQLERQLVDAGRRRASRGRWRLALAGRGRPLLAVATMLLVVVSAAAAVPLLRSDSSPGPAGSGAPPAPPAVSPPPPAASPPAAAGTRSLRGTRVAVFNGTTRSGAARAVAERLDAQGATLDAVGNGADQTRAHTAVLYGPGAEAQARRVAALLGVRDVVPRTRVEVVIAPDAAVVVHVGSDRPGP